MSQIKKYGAFAGVFTPSILTILGVIMYMRLGWVVGEAGLIGALGIIILAHIISLTTGLSISSIATDKKIKTGGIYYMLSRSLGLPMGGAIGITIFIGTAFSIALYIIGFCENFLGIDVIRNFLGLGITINDFRILGTIVLILLALVAFIGTSIAIKAQFFIMGAIVLSLVSIFIGLFTGDSLLPDPVSITSSGTGVSFIVIFAIFFPAVTGFTAGVAMSGDLKNPKKNIPGGTLAAIVIGLIIYIVLAICFAYFVDRDLLINDKNFLLKIAWFSPLVIAGIWGATLSSALGGILGAPRILQAISKDKIGPKIFSIGYGKNNEPRNALLLSFIIAEVGILIGELDVIARLVSMFFIAAYGFINLAFALEKWASIDFRPSFKISKWIGIIGFFASFGVMFKLDTLAMIIALFFISSVYFIIKRKELQLDFGDVWQSVWSSVIRKALHKMNQKVIDERNWRPNIILFSGSIGSRPHLLEIGKHLVGKLGFLSNFDLIENMSAKVLITKLKQTQSSKESDENQGIYTRRQECRDIYEGIETIAASYGFSGVEPNTVLLGWGKNSEHPEKFVHLIKRLTDYDLNTLLLHYDKKKGFGEYKQIDVWWRGGSNNGNFVLSLIKFITLSEEWRNAKVRLIIVNPVNEEMKNLYDDTAVILENVRLNAEIKIINNQIEQKSIFDIIKSESVNTDLTFLGIPEIEIGHENEFIKNINKLCNYVGTVILAKASSYFKELKIGDSSNDNNASQKHNLFYNKQLINEKNNSTIKHDDNVLENISFPKKSILKHEATLLYEKIELYNRNYFNEYLKIFSQLNISIIQKATEIIEDIFSEIKSSAKSNIGFDLERALLRHHSNLLIQLRKLSEKYRNEIILKQHDLLAKGYDRYFRNIDYYLNTITKKIVLSLKEKDLVYDELDSKKLKKFKKKNLRKLKRKRKVPTFSIEYRKLIRSYFPGNLAVMLYEIARETGLISMEIIINFQKLDQSINDSFALLEKKIGTEKLTIEDINIEQEKLSDKIDHIGNSNSTSFTSVFDKMRTDTALSIQNICNDLDDLLINKRIKKDSFNKALKIRKALTDYPHQWKTDQNLINNSLILEQLLNLYLLKIRIVLINIYREIEQKINSTIYKKQIGLVIYLKNLVKELKEDKTIEFKYEVDDFSINKITASFYDIFESTSRKVKAAAVIFPESIEILKDEDLNNFLEIQFEEKEVDKINVRRLIDYITQSELIDNIEKSYSELPDKIKEINSSTIECINYLSITFNNTDNEINYDKLDIIDLINYQINKMEKTISETNQLKDKLFDHLNERINTFRNNLALITFLKSSDNLMQDSREYKRKKILFKIKRFWLRKR
ncbi:MAG: hypothetical protein K8R41_07670 [Bacteroidales bacterium]|nr:hypothetical protein [Bacteroidales bacterium]